MSITICCNDASRWNVCPTALDYLYLLLIFTWFISCIIFIINIFSLFSYLLSVLLLLSFLWSFSFSILSIYPLLFFCFCFLFSLLFFLFSLFLLYLSVCFCFLCVSVNNVYFLYAGFFRLKHKCDSDPIKGLGNRFDALCSPLANKIVRSKVSVQLVNLEHYRY